MNPAIHNPHSALPSRRPVIWIAQGYWVEPIFHGIAKVAAERGWIIDASMRWMRGPVQPPTFKPDGVIIFTGVTPGLEDIVKKLGVPTVDIEDYCDRYGAPKVIGDDRATGRMAARHLAACAPSRLVSIVPSKENPVTQARMAGFRAEAAEAGLPAFAVTMADFDPRVLTREGPVGVFAGGDPAALVLLRRCLDAGVRVPEDIAILGADDTEYICDLAPVPLSSINMNFEAKGRAAAELLGTLMLGEKPPAHPIVIPPASVTVRTSTTVLRTGHEALDRLVRHFRENAHRHVGVDTLCEECGLPLRTAQHLLKGRLDTSPIALLTRFRLENVRRIERTGHLKRDAVARAAGFGGRSALARAVRAELRDGEDSPPPR
jgi:LacI family transcriptional regulator